MIDVLYLLLGEGRSSDGSLVVSMEINGIHYQGVLFAQPGSQKKKKKQA